jgi:hypothetical protein
MENNFAFVFSAAFVFAACMLASRVWLTTLVLLGVVGINLPETMLLGMNLDRDVLLGAVCALILVPTVYELMNS